jgi:RNA polymerase-binding transcription factor DksA
MAATKKAPAKKAPARKVPAKKAPGKPAGSKRAQMNATVSRASAKSSAAKRSTPRAAGAKAAPPKKGSVAKAPAKKAATAGPTKASPTKTSLNKTSATKTPVTKTPATKAPATKAPAKRANAAAIVGGIQLPEPRGVSKDGIAYTKDFDIKFLKAQRDLLDEEKAKLMGQATRLENEANSLIEEAEMGDVQFDDEGGEGDTMVVERERDLALSAQARQTIADIDEALARLAKGTYGYSAASGRPIPRERLEAIPWATVLVEEKVGGIGRR